MNWLSLDNRERVMQIFEQLISNKTEIKVQVTGDRTAFASKVIKINKENIFSKIQSGPDLIIEKLVPGRGNKIIQSSSEVGIEFIINENVYTCSASYNGISSMHPYFGFILSFPESIEIKEKRSEERFTYETPEFVSAEFKLRNGAKEEKLYNLNVLDCSSHGLGLIVTEDNFDLLQKLRKGDRLKDITFYATWTMIQVNGTVRHKTKIEKGKYRDCYLLGIESPEIIESCKPIK